MRLAAFGRGLGGAALVALLAGPLACREAASSERPPDTDPAVEEALRALGYVG